MSAETGQLSINSENILPIIKKWLYSDKDIFIREMVSNASDAITKLNKLVQMGEASVSDEEKYKVEVTVDKPGGRLIFSDNGIGMTADEVKQYINQIAFSGAADFINKYKDQGGDDIIGHFGLGFYSAFMVSSTVEIETLSYQESAVPVKWVCEGGSEYQMEEGSRTERGTAITLFINDDEKDFLNEHTIRAILKKYCSFMPYEIYIINTETENAAASKEEEAGVPEEIDDITEDLKAEEDGDEFKHVESEAKFAPKPINDTNPLWLKQAKDCTDEEYKEFYRSVFFDFSEPLFWIHLNMDYPFRLKGILYFPRIKSDIELTEGQVKLYNNQVYVADNIKEVIPEFLLLLKGVMDCPDLPLNVSRSFLQNDGYAKKMSTYIIKKVADKLNSVYKDRKEEYEGFWDDISVFIKYGCIKERSFYDKVKDVLLFKSIYGNYITLSEYLEKNKDEKKVYYVSDEKLQAQYIKMFKDNGQEAFILGSTIDNPFISFLEMAEQKFTFNRIDSYVSESIKEKSEAGDEENKEIKEQLEALFKSSLGIEKLNLAVENLKTPSVSAIMTIDEHARRMGEMSKMFGGMDFGNMGDMKETLVINSNNSLVKALLELKNDESQKENISLICGQIYDLALMGQKPLEPEEMMKFIERSNIILEKLVK